MTDTRTYFDRAAYMREWRKTPAGRAWLERRKARRKQWRIENPEKALEISRRERFKKRYGITLAKYEEMFAAQDGCCAACGWKAVPLADGLKMDILHVDHDHETGAVRALLCTFCNQALGLVGDDLGRVESLAAYLRRWSP